MTKCLKCSAEIKKGETVCPECQSPVNKSLSLSGILKQMDMTIAVFCLSAMILISLFQIIARNVFHKGGIGDADVIVRHLVLWVVFLGAGIASRSNRHINMDLILRILPPNIKMVTDLVVNIFSSAVSAVLCYAAVNFVYSEYLNGLKFSSFNVPVWTIEVIIPAGYAFITVYFLLNAALIFTEKAKEL